MRTTRHMKLIFYPIGTLFPLTRAFFLLFPSVRILQASCHTSPSLPLLFIFFTEHQIPVCAWLQILNSGQVLEQDPLGAIRSIITIGSGFLARSTVASMSAKKQQHSARGVSSRFTDKPAVLKEMSRLSHALPLKPVTWFPVTDNTTWKQPALLLTY